MGRGADRQETDARMRRYPRGDSAPRLTAHVTDVAICTRFYDAFIASCYQGTALVLPPRCYYAIDMTEVGQVYNGWTRSWRGPACAWLAGLIFEPKINFSSKMQKHDSQTLMLDHPQALTYRHFPCILQYCFVINMTRRIVSVINRFKERMAINIWMMKASDCYILRLCSQNQFHYHSLRNYETSWHVVLTFIANLTTVYTPRWCMDPDEYSDRA